MQEVLLIVCCCVVLDGQVVVVVVLLEWLGTLTWVVASYYLNLAQVLQG